MAAGVRETVSSWDLKTAVSDAEQVDSRVIVAALALTLALAGVIWGVGNAGGSDTYGYISQAELWLRGQIREPQPWVAAVPWPKAPWTFSPLGYRPAGDSPDGTLVPTYSPGLSALMALAKIVAGDRAMYWITPLAAAVFVIGTYGIGLRLGSARIGLVAAALIAASPVVMDNISMPMTDLPVAAAWTAAAWLSLGTTRRSAFGAGAVSALALLIRPNLAPIVAVLALAFLVQWRLATREDRGAALQRAGLFVAGALPAVAIAAILNAVLFGSPLQSGYGSLESLFQTQNVWPNLRSYTRWLIERETPVALAGLIIMLVPLRQLWPDVRHRTGLLMGCMLVLVVWIEYFAYQVFGHWSYLRFLLPTWPFIMLGTAALLWLFARRFGSAGRRVLILVVLVLAGRGLWLAGRSGAFGAREGESKFWIAARVIRERTNANSVVLSGLHSGSIRFYGGRVTMRCDDIAPDWLDRSVEWLSARGVHAYALFEEEEVKAFRARYGAQSTIGRLSMSPAAILVAPTTTLYFYDLLRTDATEPIEAVIEKKPPAGYARPVPPPRLGFRPVPQ